MYAAIVSAASAPGDFWGHRARAATTPAGMSSRLPPAAYQASATASPRTEPELRLTVIGGQSVVPACRAQPRSVQLWALWVSTSLTASITRADVVSVDMRVPGRRLDGWSG